MGGPLEAGSNDVRTELLRVGVFIDVLFAVKALHLEKFGPKREIIRASLLEDIKKDCCKIWKEILSGRLYFELN